MFSAFIPFMTAQWVLFFISSAFIVAAGIAVGRLSGELGERLKLGRAWSGAVLLSLATTLPELVTTLTLAIRGDIGLAVGGILGSVVVNLFILVLADLADPDPIYHRVSATHLATGLLGCLLLGLWITGFSVGMAPRLLGVSVGVVGIVVPLAVIGAYGLGQFVLFQMVKGTAEESTPLKNPSRFDKTSTGVLLLLYAGVAGVILVSGHRLGLTVERLSGHYGWGTTFAGATLLGIVTSLPEITNAVACARRQEFDLAVGNVMGANAMVLGVLALAAFIGGPRLFFHAIPVREALAALSMAGIALVMQSTALGALAVRSRHRLWRLGLASVFLFALYASSLIMAYRMGIGR